MAAKDLGQKYTCFKCSTKFYDLRKPIPVCPKCGVDQREMPVVKASSRKSAPKAVEEAETEAPELDEELEKEEEDEAEEPEPEAE
jgi:uncharacterized protein (TIGR02300 family)